MEVMSEDISVHGGSNGSPREQQPCHRATLLLHIRRSSLTTHTRSCVSAREEKTVAFRRCCPYANAHRVRNAHGSLATRFTPPPAFLPSGRVRPAMRIPTPPTERKPRESQP